jgi:hypothetical protein
MMWHAPLNPIEKKPMRISRTGCFGGPIVKTQEFYSILVYKELIANEKFPTEIG